LIPHKGPSAVHAVAAVPGIWLACWQAGRQRAGRVIHNETGGTFAVKTDLLTNSWAPTLGARENGGETGNAALATVLEQVMAPAISVIMHMPCSGHHPMTMVFP
jgi:hypothetical protein